VKENLSVRSYVYSCPTTSLVSIAREIRTEPEQNAKQYGREVQKKRQEAYSGKILHGQYVRDTKDVVNTEWSYKWLKTSGLKRETEALIMAAQEQSLRTNSIKAKIDKTIQSDRCRMCSKAQETADHVVSGCEKLAQREYKRRHDRIASLAHWTIAKKEGFEVKPQWYKHVATSVLESGSTKILWDFNIQTDNVIEARRPDIVVVNKQKQEAIIIDVAVPSDKNVFTKQDEKIHKYQDLAVELKRIWKLKKVPEVVPVVVGALGATPKQQETHLRKIGLEASRKDIQKAALLGTARILRRVLSLPGDRR